MATWRYRRFGLVVASAIRLPEWAPDELAEPEEAPDVVFRVESGFSGGVEAAADRQSECVVEAPRRGRLRIRAGCEVRIAPYEAVEAAELRPWLIGSAWAAICYQRGLFIVHASAVQVTPKEAVLFCGPPGRGKSTLAAQLGVAGEFPLVSDDLCRLDVPADGPVVIYPSAARLKLWSDAIEELNWKDRIVERDFLRPGKYYATAERKIGAEPLRLRTIYTLDWGDFGVRELRGAAALQRFLSAGVYRRRLLESTGQAASYSSRCLDLLRRVPLLELIRPRDFAASRGSISFLIRHWSGTPEC